MVLNKWKVVAWIFIILFLLETALIIYSYKIGTEMENNKLKCSNEICFDIEADSFVYDDYTGTCDCYKNDEIVKRKILT